MKSYQVFYILKQNKREELRHIFIHANNQKEACAKCREVVKEQTGKNAFRATTSLPYEVTTISGRKYMTI